jgi:uncharacterized circularly permuted ATP-grasp superfamily protein/uncharacterized alpha-E superfamily protein
VTVLREYAATLAQPSLPGDSDTAPYDEVVGPDGSLRPAWKALAETAVAITSTDMRRVDGDITEMLADDGVTYARPGQGSGPWQLDPVPLILDHETWRQLEEGLAQRAELLNAVLADLYGPRQLLSSGLLPPAVVFGHGGFTRVVARGSMRDPRPLVFSATDLGRDATGEWRVLGDRAQAPSGLGYAMENRRVISRVMPELYRQAGLHRMEPYFWALRSALIQSAEELHRDPRVVVLSPGTQSETAYDQSFVASALGFPLVQGSDLLVRDGWVWMRQPGATADRLERVDVILRRVDAAWSDPLELRGESQLGVAGLTEAVRRGRVRIVNGLGAGVLENPGLLPYMPIMCESLLGEQLRLGSVPTWWCGDPRSMEQVLDRIDELSIRMIDGPSAGLVGLSVREVVARITAAPHRYVGQEQLALSQAPSWGAGGRITGAVQARPVTLRTFTLRYGAAYRPLVGGLANVYEGNDRAAGPQSSKDVWILKESSDVPDQGLTDVLPVTSARTASVLVPRVLEDMFWIGRYAERAEDMLRLLMTAHVYAEDFKMRPRTTGFSTLEILRAAIHHLAGPAPTTGAEDPYDHDFRSLLLDPARVGSVAHSLAALRDALQGVRDQMSHDTWRGFGTIDRASAALLTQSHTHQVAESAGRMLTGILALQGVTASMMRDAGWHILGAGRHLERALQVTRVLAATTTVRRGIDVDREVLNAALAASESAVTHRRRYRGYVRPAGVLELLLIDPDNPRSLAFSLAAIREHLAAQPASTGSTRPERLLGDLENSVADADLAALVAIGGVGRPNLEAFLAATASTLMLLGEAIAEQHFAQGPAPRTLATMQVTEMPFGAP